MLTHVDLFSGIGGFSLAARWAGFTTVLHCEIDPYCQKVLHKHWPEVPIAKDVRLLTGESIRAAVRAMCCPAPDVPYPECAEWGQDDTGFLRGEGRDGLQAERHEGATRLTECGQVDLLTGGFPCQPFSVAGKQRGKDDDRHLWPEMLRLIAETRPRVICAENVNGFVHMALDDVCLDLEAAGYEVQPLVFPACGVGAWHKRERVFIVAHATGQRLPDGRGAPMADTGDAQPEPQRLGGARSRIQDVPDAESGRWDERHDGIRAGTNGEGCALSRDVGGSDWLTWDGRQPLDTIWQSEPAVCGMVDGLPAGMDYCGRLVSRLPGRKPGRVPRLKALGNAVSPQQAYPVLAAIRAAL